jgi:hypothetical protein
MVKSHSMGFEVCSENIESLIDTTGIAETHSIVLHAFAR